MNQNGNSLSTVGLHPAASSKIYEEQVSLNERFSAP